MTDRPEPHGRLRHVVRPHNASQPVSIRLRAGDVVTVGRRDEHWTDWLWCTAVDGSQSWVPESFLTMAPVRTPGSDTAAPALHLSTTSGS